VPISNIIGSFALLLLAHPQFTRVLSPRPVLPELPATRRLPPSLSRSTARAFCFLEPIPSTLKSGTVVYSAFSNSCWSLLLVVSYLWGGCISCQQFFMLPGSKGHCCEQRCKNPAKKTSDSAGSHTTPRDCQTMPLERSSAAYSHSDLAAPLADISLPATDLIELARSHASAAIEFDPSAGSPPDIPVMGAALLL